MGLDFVTSVSDQEVSRRSTYAASASQRERDDETVQSSEVRSLNRKRRAASPSTRDTVIFISHTVLFGGSTKSLQSLLQNIGAGVRRVLVTPSGGPVVSQLSADGSVDEVVTSPWLLQESTPRSVLAWIITVARTAMRLRHRLAAIHANGVPDVTYAALAAVVTGAPLVVWAHDDDPSQRRSRHVARPISRSLRRIRWVTVSGAAADMLAAAGVVERERIEVIPNPIEQSVARLDRSDPAGTVRIGFLGTDSTRKGFDLLPEIVAGLDRPNARLLVFARHHDDVGPEMQRAWEALQANPQVEHRGRQTDVALAYRDCDIVLCPSRIESFCRVAAEAMMNGITVVAADLPAIREVIGDSGAGSLFPPGDVGAAVRALQRMVDEEPARVALGAAGRYRAHTFDPEGVARSFRSLYGLSVAPSDLGSG